MKIRLLVSVSLLAAGSLFAQNNTPPAAAPGDTVKTNIAATPEQRAQLSYNKGIDDFTKGSYKEALTDFDTAIAIKPAFEEAYLNRGNTKLKLKDYSGAITDYSKATELNPKDDKAFYGIGQCQNALGATDKAADAYSKAVDANPKNADAFYYRGEIRFVSYDISHVKIYLLQSRV